MKIKEKKIALGERLIKNEQFKKKNFENNNKDCRILNNKPIYIFKIKKYNKYNQYRNIDNKNNNNKKFVLKSISPKPPLIFSTPKTLRTNRIFYNKIHSTNKNEKDEFNDINEHKTEIYNIENSNDKNLTENKNIVYTKKSIKKNKKINVHVHKKNFSMNYYININANLKNNELNTCEYNINKDEIKIKPNICKCTLITKQIIGNKKEELSKIIFIQNMWKKILKQKLKNIIYDYKEILDLFPNSLNTFNIYKKNRTINLSNNSNISNNNTILSYSNKKDDNIKQHYNTYKYNISSNLAIKNLAKSGNFDLTGIIPCQSRNGNKNRMYNNTYKNKNINMNLNINNDNENNILSYSNSNTIDNYIYSYTNPSTIKIKRKINYSLSDNKKRRKSVNSISIKNKLNKYVKNKIQFEYKPHITDTYKCLIPNQHFINFTYNIKEEALPLNNKKNNTLIVPDVSRMKKIKKKKKDKNNKTIDNKNDININEDEKLNLIKKYYLKDNKSIEPRLHLENKLIMKKPVLRKRNKK